MSSSRVLVATVLVTGLMELTLSPTAAAQSQVIITSVDTTPSSSPFVTPYIPATAKVVAVDLPQRAVSWYVSYPDAESRMPTGPVVVTHDARQAMWIIDNNGAPVIAVRDLVTHAMSTRALSIEPRTLLAHPRRSIVIATSATHVAKIEGSSETAVQVCPLIRDTALSFDGSQLFVACQTSVEILSSSDLSLVRSLSVGPSFGGGGFKIEVNATTTRFALADAAAAKLYDAVSGALVATFPAPIQSWFPGDSVGALFLGAIADRTQLLAVYATQGPRGRKSGVSTVLDFTSLSTVATGLPLFDTVEFSADGRLAVASQQIPGLLKQIAFIDTAAGAIEWITSGNGIPDNTPASHAAIANAPLAPVNVSTSVVNRTVTVGWQLLPQSSAATRYHVDVRLTPSGPVVATLTTEASTLMVDNAPPGNYFLSIRGQNYRGVGDASPSYPVSVR